MRRAKKRCVLAGAAILFAASATAASAQYGESVLDFQADAVCGPNAPHLVYSATVTGSNATTLTLHWLDSEGDERLVQPGLPLQGQVLFPGVVVDANGNGIDWPGWSFINGTWTEADDGFGWSRTASVFATTDSTSDVVGVTYPASNPTCVANPTQVLPSTQERTLTQVQGVQLARTGDDTSVPATQVAAGLIGVGALAVAAGRRRRSGTTA